MQQPPPCPLHQHPAWSDLAQRVIRRDARVLALLKDPRRAATITGGLLQAHLNVGTPAVFAPPARSPHAPQPEVPATDQQYSLTRHSHAALPTIDIASHTLTGLRLGIAHVLDNLRGGPAVPEGMSEHAPAFATRGLMLDISRTRVPTMQHLHTVLDECALLRCNHLQLYIEHTFAYAGHDAAWTGTSPITPDEMTRLHDACAERGIALAGNQNCFGHLRHWLELPAYADLAETHGDWMFDIWPRSGPFSLCPSDPRSLALVRDWISQQSRVLPGSLFNINCDEVYDIAYGRSAELVRNRGRVRIFAEFVSQVCEIVRSCGKRPLFWSDVVLTHDASHDQALSLLHAHNPVALVWGYEPDTPFEEWSRRVAWQGLENWVCPGTSCWRALTGRTTERQHNLDAALRARTHASGLLLCAWGDCGHWQQWPITRHALQEGLRGAWAGVREGVTHSRMRPLTEWMDAFGNVDETLRRVAGGLSKPGLTRLRNQTALFASLAHGRTSLQQVGHAEAWREAAQRLCACARDVSVHLAGDSLEADELMHTVRLSGLACARALWMLGGADAHELCGQVLREACGAPIGTDLEQVLRAGFQDAEAEHCRLWLTRSRRGGLAQSCAHFAAIDRLWDANTEQA